jgi:hypothetical protein
VFRAAPLAWLALVFAYVIITQLVAVVPFAGPALAAVLVPPFTVGFMSAARAGSRGAPVELGMLFEAFRGAPGRQLVLGAIYAACLVAVFGGATLAVGPDALRATAGGETPAEARVGQVLSLVAVLFLLYAPVMMMFWFAPPLAAWHDASPGKALFYSFFAFLLNWRAFLLYGAIAAVFVAAAPLLALHALAAVLGPLSRNAVAGAVLSLVLILMPTLFASFYASYRDVFGAEKAP